MKKLSKGWNDSYVMLLQNTSLKNCLPKGIHSDRSQKVVASRGAKWEINWKGAPIWSNGNVIYVILGGGLYRCTQLTRLIDLNA